MASGSGQDRGSGRCGDDSTRVHHRVQSPVKLANLSTTPWHTQPLRRTPPAAGQFPISFASTSPQSRFYFPSTTSQQPEHFPSTTACMNSERPCNHRCSTWSSSSSRGCHEKQPTGTLSTSCGASARPTVTGGGRPFAARTSLLCVCIDEKFQAMATTEQRLSTAKGPRSGLMTLKALPNRKRLEAWRRGASG